MFRVVPDQLKISDGWVRCGHCADVFDATLYLDEWTDGDAPSPAAVEAPVPPPEPVLPRGIPAAERPVAAASTPAPWPFDDEAPGEPLSGFTPLEDVRPTEPMPLPDRVSDALSRAMLPPSRDEAVATKPAGAVEVEGVSPAPAAPEASQPDRAVRPRQGVAEDFRAELLQFASSSGAADTAMVDAVDVPIGLPLHAERQERTSTGSSAPARESRVAAEPEQESPEPEPVPQFVQQARRKAFWRKPWVRGMLSLLCMALALALLAQWTLHERHRLMAWQPQLEPVLRLVCAPPACDLGPVRRIDDIVIDSAALVRRLGNIYSFDIVLKNRSDIPLAVPALELTLTDTRDQTIARRVFLPSEWPGQPAQVPARGSIDVNLRLAIDLADGMPMAGYRALVFYP